MIKKDIDEILDEAQDEIYIFDEEYIDDEDDNVIFFQIDNLYKDDNKFFSTKDLLTNPPELKIFNKNNTTSIILTKDVSENLSEIFNDVNKAYNFLYPRNKKDIKLKDLPSEIKHFIVEQKLKTTLLFIFIIFFTWVFIF